jgi:Cell division protein FtsQ
VAVAGSKRKRSSTSSGWSWRLAGIALCAFFALGVMTGLSRSGRRLARRIEELLDHLPRGSRSELMPAAYHAFFGEATTEKFERSPAISVTPTSTEAIALVEHSDGFYQLNGVGELIGPVSLPTADLPVLSGSGIESARGSKLVDYAGQVVRAEAALSAIVSEVRVAASGEITLFLDSPHVVIVLAPGQLPLQLARAARVLQIWRGHSDLIATIDMTVPGEAIVRRKAQSMERAEAARPSRPAAAAPEFVSSRSLIKTEVAGKD